MPLIVGIGASAGGLEAFKTFFGHMPADSGMAFVVVQHLDPDHHSLLAELLTAHTPMPVLEAEDGMKVSANHVFIIPPDATLTIQRGCLQVETPAPARVNRHPIDAFFASLAVDQGENAVCIVLSGAGSDGTLGLKKIKEHGGFALAQEGLGNWVGRGMPASATATGLVDYTIPIADMPAQLLGYQHHLRQVAARKDADGTRGDAADYLGTITELVHNQIGHDFSGYKEKTLVRRVQRRMQVLQVGAVPDYIERLRTEPVELNLLFDDLLIGVTQFFRDPEAWETLEKTVIPALIKDRSATDDIRIWVPGCGTGEEAYSIAMLLTEAMDRSGSPATVQIFGSDIDARAIEIARGGRYPKGLAGLTPARRERFFTADRSGISDRKDSWQVHKRIREMCIFAVHSLIKDPPFSRLDLISCRNVLIYMNRDLQDQVMHQFHYALKPDGWLFLGKSEGVGRNNRLFAAIDKQRRLFQRQTTGDSASIDAIEVRRPRRPHGAEPAPARNVAWVGDALDRRARGVMEKYAIPFVVIGADRSIVRFSGGTTGHYLEPSAGVASFELLSMVKKALRPAVRAAVQRTLETGKPSVHANVPVRIDGEARAVTVIVEPLDSDGGIKHCIVAFQDGGPAGGAAGGADKVSDYAALEHELRVTKAQLNAAISDLETANEEMRSANEEYQSVNEELQSSNEELETSREEAQSVNEELETVNAELTQRTESLTKANSDLRNLLESTQIATLFLDGDLHIKSFTPGMRDLFHLREGDRGRPVTDIVTRLDYREINRDAEKVLRELSMAEREVDLLDGEPKSFIMRIRPYRTVDNVIDGVVITFTDITERTRGEAERVRLAEIVRSSRDAIIGHSLDGTIESWNPAAERMFGYSAAEAAGQRMTLLVSADRAAEVTEPLERLQRGEALAPFDLGCQTRAGERLDVELSISPVLDEQGEPIAAATVARDISARLQHEAHRDLLMHELSHRIKNTLAAVQSIMLQTRSNAATMEEFSQSFGERLRALSNAHNLLTRSDWSGADFRELVLAELKPYANNDHPRWELSGESVRLAPSETIALSMAFHELATNAAKHGALSTAGGRIGLSWTVADADAGRRMLHLEWVERNGPIVRKPARRGFGSRLLNEGLSYELDADVTLDFDAKGVRCVIDVPIDSVENSGGGKHY